MPACGRSYSRFLLIVLNLAGDLFRKSDTHATCSWHPMMWSVTVVPDLGQPIMNIGLGIPTPSSCQVPSIDQKIVARLVGDLKGWPHCSVDFRIEIVDHELKALSVKEGQDLM